jgi:PPK2 family polyphosphate:nucleotide phosphotransferase
MKIDIKDFRVAQGKKVNLDKWPTKVKPVYKSKKEYKSMLNKQVEELSEQQQLHYASNNYAVLLIFQAMDAAGKDGAIKHVMSGINPQGCQVFSFKHPSATELEHDFLWRTTQALPERGRIGIFNRSYYEEVLVVRVHPVDMENHLHRNGTRIVKFFLHLSEDEQRKRFLGRIDDQDKNWKFSLADMTERKSWKQYMQAYQDCLGATSTRDAPWYVVPADDKENARLIISEILLDTFKSLKLAYPKVSTEHKRELQLIRKQLVK